MSGGAASSAWKAAQAGGEHWGLAVKSCLETLGPLPDGANLGFLYVTEGFADDLSSIVTFLHETTRIEAWTGAVGYGVLGPQGMTRQGSSLALMVGRLDPSGWRLFDGFDPIEPKGFLSDHGAWLNRQQNTVTALVHADPREPQLVDMIDGLAHLGRAFLVGGITIPAETPSQVAGRVSGAGLSGLLLGDGVAVATGLSQGCQPIGPPHRVTEVVDNVVMGLDGRSALEILKAEAGDIIARDLRRAQGYIHVALPTEGADDPHDYQVRNLLAVDPRRGWLAIGERMDSGDRLMFVRRDPQAAQRDLERMLRGLARRLDGRRPVAGVYVSCVARGAQMFGADSGEAQMIADILGSFPLVGFSASGEICHDRLYSYTGVLILFL